MKKVRFMALLLVGIILISTAAMASTQGASPAPHHNPFAWMLSMMGVGLILNAESLAGITTGFKTIYNNALRAVTPQYPKIAMVLPSTTEFNTYAWMEQLAQMREWLGARDIQNISVQEYTIKNLLYELTIAVERAKLEDDQYGVYNIRFAAMARSVIMHPDQLVFPLFIAGFTTGKSYDGLTFFSTAHKSGSNKATYVLSHENYGAAKALLGATRDSKGQPFFDGTEKYTLVTGTKLETTARQILNGEFISVANGSTQTNVWKGDADYVKNPRITSDTAWFLVVTLPLKAEETGQVANREPIKIMDQMPSAFAPFIYQPRTAPEWQQQVDPNTSAMVFDEDKYLYGVRQRDNAGYGLHQLCFGSTGVG